MPILEEQWRLNEELFTTLAVAGVVFGFLQCCWGYRIWRFVLGVNGVVYGLIAGLVVAAVVRPSEAAAVLGIQLLCAALLAFLFAGIKPLGTFFVGAGIGAAVVAMVVDAFSLAGSVEDNALIGLMCLAGLIAGIVFAASGRGGIVVLSSLNGAVVLVSGGFGLSQIGQGRAPSATIETDVLQLCCIAGAAVVALAIQFGATARTRTAATSTDSVSASSDRRPPPKPSATGRTPSRESEAGVRLAKLDRLKAAGAIGASEYEQHRTRILGEQAQRSSQVGAADEATRREAEQLRVELERERARSASLETQRQREQRELKSEIDRAREEKENDGAGRVLGGILSLIVFALIVWWFLESDGAEELRRYLIWKDSFGRFFGR